MNIFYSPGVSGNFHILPESESKHAAQVLRMQKGDRAMIFDGSGGKFVVEIIESHPRKCEVRILEKEIIERRNFYLHIAIAPTKMNERMEWFLEKATEIGIDEITPVICSRSERRNTNHDRFEKVIIAAMKQSMNPWLPVLNEHISFEEFIKNSNQGFIAHCHESKKNHLKNVNSVDNKYIVIVGPEGDFTETEVELAIKSGWQEVSLGTPRLRTETAGVVACHTINMMKS